MNKFLINIVTGTSILALSAGSLYASKPWENNNNDPASYSQPAIQQPATSSLEENLDRAFQNDRETFMNFNDLDMNLVHAFRVEYNRVQPKTDANLHTTHFPTLIPFLRKFQSFINDYCQNPMASQETKDLVEDINGDIEHLLKIRKTTKQPIVTIAFFLDVHSRFIASLSNPTEDEKSVFLHAVNPEYLLGLYENDAWKTPLKAFTETDEFDNKGKDSEVKFDAPYVSENVINFVENMIQDQLGPRIHYPMLGQDKLGIPFLTLNAIRRIYPFAYQPTRVVGAHGIDDASPAGLSAHDFVHAELDPRTDILMKHILEYVNKKFEDAVLSGLEYDAMQIAKIYAPIAIQRFLKIEQTFEQYFVHLVNELPNTGLADFKKVMAGFFWVMREQVGFNPALFGPMTFKQVIESYVNKSLEKLNDQESSWEVTDNPFLTSPIDGKSPFSAQEIIDAVKAEEDLEKQYGRIIDAQVEYSPKGDDAKARFIDVKFTFANGSEKTLDFTTLYHRMKNIEDARGLLNWAGLDLPGAPNLEDLTPEDAMKQATVYIDGIRGHLVNMINLFRESFIQYVVPEISEQYATWTATTEDDVNQQLPIPDAKKVTADRIAQQEATTAAAIAAVEEIKESIDENNELLKLLDQKFKLDQEAYQAKIDKENAENEAQIKAMEASIAESLAKLAAERDLAIAEHEAQIKAFKADLERLAAQTGPEVALQNAHREAVNELQETLPNLSQELQDLVGTGKLIGLSSPDFNAFKRNTDDFYKLIRGLETLNATDKQCVAILPSPDRLNRWAENTIEVALPMLEAAIVGESTLFEFFRNANLVNQIRAILTKVENLYPRTFNLMTFQSIAQLKIKVESLKSIVAQKK